MKQANYFPVYDSASQKHPAVTELQELMRYRHLVMQIIRRNLLARYKRSVLGVAWTMLNPLGMMIIMTVVFSTVFGREPGYPAYLLSGLLAWNFFSEVTNTIMNNLVWGGNLLKEIYVPRTVFALSSAGTGMINLLLSVVPLLIVLVAVRIPIRASILFLPIPVLLLLFFSLGFGLLLSLVAMYFPDVAEMYNVALRGWMYLTPIIYPENLLRNANLEWLLFLNPLYHLIKIFRTPINAGQIPTIEELWPAVLFSGVMLMIGWLIFTKRSDEFAYRV